jgi:type VI secretion system protein ImpM
MSSLDSAARCNRPMQTASAAGFYGKLPCKGDFLQRRIAQEFVDAWDTWLQQCLFASREQLQEGWLDAYLTSPVWRFALAEGVCGSGAYAGVMVPSVDRVGRYFPLTLVVQLDTEDCLLDLASDAVRPWFDSAESLALGALQAHDLDLSFFDEQVAALARPLNDLEAAESAHLRQLLQRSPFASRPAQWQVPLRSVHSLQRAANVFACRELERALRPLALWWTDGSDAVTPCWLCNRGLPSPASFAAMIAGGWDHFGWQSLGPPAASAQHPPLSAERSAELSPDSAYLPGQPVGMGDIGSAIEPVEIVTCHTAAARQVDVVPGAYFVSRPDVGLWGLSCSDGHDAATAQTVADLLHDISAAASLSSFAEEIRRALEMARRRSAVHGPAAEVGAVVFLMSADECAVICAGRVQALRVRAFEVTAIEGTAQWARAAHDHLEPAPAAPDTSLLDLLAAPTIDDEPTVVHYETLQSGDVWLLSGVLLSDPGSLANLPAVLAQHRLGDEAMLAAVGRLWEQEMGVDERGPPLMLVAAAPAGQ